MAQDGPLDVQAAALDARVNDEGDGPLAVSKSFVEVELSPTSSQLSKTDQDSPLLPTSTGRPKALSVPMSPPLNGQDNDGSNEPSPSLWDLRRRTQSDSNLRVDVSSLGAISTLNPAVRAGLLASPAHSESALLINGEKESSAGPLLPISVKPTSNGLMGDFLTGIADLTKSKSPRGIPQKVEVLYPIPGPLFVDLFSRDDGTGAQVKGFRRKPDGSMADAEASGRVFPNDELVGINKVTVAYMEFADIIKTAKEAAFPLTLTFHCYHANRNVFEKQQKPQQTQPPDRKYSSGPLPPPSPSSAWSSKFGQITRSGSFDQKTINGGNVPRSPSSSPTTSDTNTGKFGISLDKVRNTGTDGMKNLFRIMGNKSSRPEEDQSVVRGWMENLSLKPHSASNGRHRKTPANTNADVLHSTPIVAVTTGGRFVGVLDEDVHEFALTWYRKTPPDNDVHQIKNVNRCPYFPSVDDVGSILSLQCESLRFPKLKRVVEMPQPLVLDPAVGNMVDVLLEAGAGSFSATLASNEHDSFQIKIVADAVTLVKISEQEDEGGVVVNADYSSFLQVLLDPTDQLRFILKVQEFGGFLGNCEGDVCDLKNRQGDFAALSCFFLVAQNRQHRDILTLLIRKFRATVLTPEQEELAQRDETSLFMDPAFVVAVATPATLGASHSGANRSSSGALSPGNSGDTASNVGSPTTPSRNSTPVSNSIFSPRAVKARPGRLQSEDSIGSANMRFSDLVGLEADNSDQPRNGVESGSTTPAATPTRSALAAGKTAFGGSSSGSKGPIANDAFVEGRLAAQDKEIAMLREKLAAMSVLQKSTDQEKKQIEASVEVKDNRIELQQMKIQRLEKFPAQCNAQARELQSLRTKLEEEERRHGACREELEQVTNAATKRSTETLEQGVQTETQFLDSHVDATSFSSSGLQRDTWYGSVATVSADDLQQQIKNQQTDIARLQNEQVNLVAERNMYRAKSGELSTELRKLVKANNNRPLDHIEAQLAERSNLEAELALVKAEAKRTADELTELKSVLGSVRDKDKGAKRLAAQNLELQRTVHQLNDSLSESRDQVNAVKKINSALAARLHRLQPDARDSLVEPPLISPQANPPSFSSDDEDDDEDDDDEDEDEELKDGIAAFRRSLVAQ